jgi:hypothetical protein
MCSVFVAVVLVAAPASATTTIGATTVSATLVASSVPQNVLAAVRGELKPHAANRLVTIERKTATGWVTVGTVYSTSDGRFGATVPTAVKGTQTLRAHVAATRTRAGAVSRAMTLTVGAPIVGHSYVDEDTTSGVLLLHELGGTHRTVRFPFVPDDTARNGRFVLRAFDGPTHTDRLYAGGPGLAQTQIYAGTSTCVLRAAISHNGRYVVWAVGKHFLRDGVNYCEEINQGYVRDLVAKTTVSLPVSGAEMLLADDMTINFNGGDSFFQFLVYDTQGAVVADRLYSVAGQRVTASGLTDLDQWWLDDLPSPAGTVTAMDPSTGQVARLTVDQDTAPVVLSGDSVVNNAVASPDGTRVFYEATVGGVGHLFLANADFSGAVDEGPSTLDTATTYAYIYWIGNDVVAVSNYDVSSGAYVATTELHSAADFSLISSTNRDFMLVYGP